MPKRLKLQLIITPESETHCNGCGMFDLFGDVEDHLEAFCYAFGKTLERDKNRRVMRSLCCIANTSSVEISE